MFFALHKVQGRFVVLQIFYQVKRLCYGGVFYSTFRMMYKAIVMSGRIIFEAILQSGQAAVLQGDDLFPLVVLTNLHHLATGIKII
jgi:hypothetical protein